MESGLTTKPPDIPPPPPDPIVEGDGLEVKMEILQEEGENAFLYYNYL